MTCRELSAVSTARTEPGRFFAPSRSGEKFVAMNSQAFRKRTMENLNWRTTRPKGRGHKCRVKQCPYIGMPGRRRRAIDHH